MEQKFKDSALKQKEFEKIMKSPNAEVKLRAAMFGCFKEETKNNPAFIKDFYKEFYTLLKRNGAVIKEDPVIKIKCFVNIPEVLPKIKFKECQVIVDYLRKKYERCNYD